jgi:hypothetical protein
LIDSKFEFLYQKEIAVSEWDHLPFWEFEEYIKRLNERNKEENKKQEEQNKQQQSQMPNMNNIAKQMQAPKISTPNFGSYLK